MPKKHSRLFPQEFTEVAVAQSFADLMGGNIRFDHTRQKFLLWDKHYWKEDRNGGIIRYVISYADMMIDEGHASSDPQFIKWGTSLKNNSKIKNIISIAKNISPITLSGDEFDTHPLLLGVQNGIVDLTTGKLRNGRTTDYISLIAPVTYDQSAFSSSWENFIDTIFDGDMELIDWIRRVLGYAITGEMKEQLVFLFYGTGGNGKSRLLDVMQGILGPYMARTPNDFFNASSFYNQINDASFMHHKRFIFNNENTEQKPLKIELIKSISTPDMQRGRKLYENPIEFLPECKMFISTNHLPKFEDDSYGFDRRMKVVPFKHVFMGKEEIKDYHKILLKESSGILNWLIESCLMWQDRGLSDIPQAVIDATSGYKIENNPLTEFLEEKTTREEGEEISSSTLYIHYQQWCLTRRQIPLTQTAFAKKMAQLSFEKTHKETGNYYLRLRLSLNPS